MRLDEATAYRMRFRRRIMMAAMGGGFPEEPTSYILLQTITSSQTFTAPTNGYYRIEVFGASGKGGKAVYNTKGSGGAQRGFAGGGGGGGAVVISEVMLKSGDTLTIVVGSVGNDTSVLINSSKSDYNEMIATSAGNGGDATATSYTQGTVGAGGTGGTATGGNILNSNGNTGGAGGKDYSSGAWSASGGSGGTSNYTGGNTGGKGADISGEDGSTVALITVGTPGAGSKGFVKIHTGDTNEAA